MEGDFIKIRESLLPLSWMYGGVVSLRNFFFEIGMLKSRSFAVPVIAVGNITVGGTGKTPHVEYLIRLLREKFHVAVLSRGYKRKTSGYLLADANSTVRDIGDEPYQMKQKYPDISVAVDKKRVNGIEQLTANDKLLDVVLLDDAFQHRYVKPGVNILLVDYHRLIIYDKLLPAGRLREPLRAKNRADIVIVTKCPSTLKPMEFRVITKALELYPYQHLYFTTLHYGSLSAVFDGATPPQRTLESLVGNNILLLTGIASPRQLQEDLNAICNGSNGAAAAHITPLTFSDHHNFKRKDIERINQMFEQLPTPRLVITTEKDAVRLKAAEGLSDDVRRHLYTLPVEIQFMQEEQEQKFNDFIIGYVRKNSRNSILSKGKEEAKPKEQPKDLDKPKKISFK
jgi:tetraacyldisaccharide 4'-kinase